MYTLDRSVPFKGCILKNILQVKKNLEGKNYKLASYREKVPLHFKVLGTISLQCFMVKLQAIPSISWIIPWLCLIGQSTASFLCMSSFLPNRILINLLVASWLFFYDTMVQCMWSAKLNHKRTWNIIELIFSYYILLGFLPNQECSILKIRPVPETAPW